MIINKIYTKAKWVLFLFTGKTRQFLLSRKFGSVGFGTRILGKVWLSEPKHIFIGERVKIGPLCRLETYSKYGVTKTDPKLIIKDNSSLQHAVHIYCNNYVELQEGVLIASGCMITDNNHGIDPIGDYYEYQPLSAKSTIIKRGVWLGENVAVLAGSIIGERSIIGANSVVKGNIPDYSIAVGNPAKVVKRYNFESKQWEKLKTDEV